MAYLPPMNGGRLNANITGNTANAGTMLSSGTMFLAGGSNVTLGQTGASIGINSPTFINSNGVTFGTNGASVTASVAAGAGGVSFSAGGSAANLASVTFSNSNNVSYGLSNGIITGSASFAQSAQTQNNIQAIGAGAATAATGTVIFSNSNNVTFGLNGQAMTASFSSPAASVGFSAGGSSASLAAVTFSNANGIGFGLSNGTITASHNALTSQSLQTSNIIQAISASGSQVNNGTVTFGNANSITFGLSNGVITASAAPDGIQGISAAGASANNGAITFSNSNNVNFGMAGSVITASANVAGGGVGIAAGGATFSTGTLGLNAGGGISFATAAQSLTISAPPVSNITATNITVNTNGSTIGFSGPAMFDAGVSNLGNTLGNTGVTANTNGLILVGGNNVTLSQSVNNANAFVTVNAGGGGTISNWEPVQLQHIYSTTSQMSYITNSNLYIYKLQVPTNVNATQLMQYANLSMSASSNSVYSGGISINAGIYTASAGASVLNLITQSTGSSAFAFTNSSGNSSSSAASYFNGMRGLIMPMNVSFTPGNYFLGVISRSTYSNAVMTAANMMAAMPTVTFAGLIGQTTNATQGIQEAIGQFTGATTLTTLPTSVSMSQIIQSFGRSTPYFFFKGVTW